MAKYEGPAEVVTADGTTIQVTADLVVPDDPVGTVTWFGKIQGEVDAFDLMDGPSTLHLPDGGHGSFMPSRTDLVLPRGGVEISGIGRPPL